MEVIKIKILDGGRYEMVVNSCFEDLEGGEDRRVCGSLFQKQEKEQ